MNKMNKNWNNFGPKWIQNTTLSEITSETKTTVTCFMAVLHKYYENSNGPTNYTVSKKSTF